MQWIKRTILGISLLTVLIYLSGFTVISHRGEPTMAPEHTYEGYDAAIRQGTDYIELDLEESYDGVLVISHDKSTKRMTQRNNVINQTPWSVLSQLKVRNGETLHSVEQVFQRYQLNPRVKIMLETRTVNGQYTMEKKLIALIQKYHFENRVYLESFLPKSLEILHSYLPKVPMMLLAGPNFESKYLYHLRDYPYVTSLAIPEIANIGKYAKIAHIQGKALVVWSNMYERPDKIAGIIHSGADGMFTNYTGVAENLLHPKQTQKEKQASVGDKIAVVYDGAVKLWKWPVNRRVSTGKIQPATSWRIIKIHKSRKGNISYCIGANKWVSSEFVKVQ